MRAGSIVIAALCAASSVASAQTADVVGKVRVQQDVRLCSPEHCIIISVTPPPPKPLPRVPVTELQTTLQTLGYYKGKADGELTNRTLEALDKALTDRAITIDGRAPHAKVLARLTDDGVIAVHQMLRDTRRTSR
jgi:hypothetical protein